MNPLQIFMNNVKFNLLYSSDDNIAFRLIVIAHTLYTIHFSKVVDNFSMVSVHWWKTMAFFCLLSL